VTLQFTAFPTPTYQMLCSYIETGGNGADSDIRPWFWILCMFLGPAVRSLAFQWYIFISTRTLVRCEALITQLVFEHSLRIRLKAESSSENNDGIHEQETSTSTAIGTPETASIAESSATGSTGDQDSVTTDAAISREPSKDSHSTQSPNASGKGNVTKPEEDKKGKKNDNLIGKINNLVTTDLSNILESRDFLLLGEDNLSMRRTCGLTIKCFPLSSICTTTSISLHCLSL
jgi:hypothetical protein